MSTVKARHSHLGMVHKTLRPTTFSTPHSKFQMNLISEMQFNMPEFSESKQAQWNFHVLPEKTKLPYDQVETLWSARLWQRHAIKHRLQTQL